MSLDDLMRDRPREFDEPFRYAETARMMRNAAATIERLSTLVNLDRPGLLHQAGQLDGAASVIERVCAGAPSARPGGERELCPRCLGTGRTDDEGNSAYSGLRCADCDGEGHRTPPLIERENDAPCTVCDGNGDDHHDDDPLSPDDCGACGGTGYRRDQRPPVGPEGEYERRVALECRILDVTEPIAAELNRLPLRRSDYKRIMDAAEKAARTALAASPPSPSVGPEIRVMVTPASGEARLVHPLLQSIRGMCSDETPFPVLDGSLAEAVQLAKDLEDALSAVTARAESAERDRDALRLDLDDELGRLEARAVAAERRREALREALEEIAKMSGWRAVVEAEVVARAALSANLSGGDEVGHNPTRRQEDEAAARAGDPTAKLGTPPRSAASRSGGDEQ